MAREIRKHLAQERLRIGLEALKMINTGKKFKEIVEHFGRSRMFIYKCVNEAADREDMLS